MKDFKYNRHKINGLKNAVFFFIYVGCLSLICLFAYKRPSYNWDMLPYMAIVLKMDHQGWDATSTHNAAYNIAKQKIPSKEYGYLIQGPYREKMAQEPTAFNAQLPFYAVKPLYLSMIYLFYKAGIDLPIATTIPSILAYFFMGLLLFYWMKEYLKPLFALISSMLIMYSGFIISVARISTPDALSSLWLLAAFYFILKKPSVTLMFLFFFLAVLTRLDNIVTCFLILSFLSFSGKWQSHVSFRQYSLMTGLLIAYYFVITFVIVHPFGWSIFYYPTFIHYFNLSYTFHQTFSLKAYLALMYSHAITTILFHHFTVFTFMALMVAYPLLSRPFSSKAGFDQWFSILLIFIILIRFIIYPNINDRFYISFYLCILTLLGKHIKTQALSNQIFTLKNVKL